MLQKGLRFWHERFWYEIIDKSFILFCLILVDMPKVGNYLIPESLVYTFHGQNFWLSSQIMGEQ